MSTSVKRPGDLPEPNDNPHPYTDFDELEIESYIATDEKKHKMFMEIENQIAEVSVVGHSDKQKQQQINELYDAQNYERGLVVAQDALAVSILRQILWQLIKSHFGENHPVYACGLNNLALMYKSLEDYDEAALYYDKALQIYEDVGKV